MTATLPTSTPSKSSSRRALLAGALGGLGALAASAIGRASPVRAGVDGDVVLGSASNSTATVTAITNTTTGDQAFAAYATGAGSGVYGQSSSSYGVWGSSSLGSGVYGYSNSGTGVYGFSASAWGLHGQSSATDAAANVGWSYGDSTALIGYSGTVSPPAAKAKTGVYGYASQDNFSRGVIGESPAGIGVYGITTSGYGGYFAGKVYTTKWYEMTEITAPAAPAANRARLFLRDNGSAKTQLCIRFNTGAVQVITTQP
jgi:hypothetical protein